MKCVFLDRSTLGEDISLDLISDQVDLRLYSQTSQDEQLILERIGEAEAVITNKVPLNSSILEKAGKLKVIFTAATGVDHIDIVAAAAKGIPVCNTRNYAGASVAQHVFASIVYFSNKLHEFNAAVTEHIWSKQDLFCLLKPQITELAGKTLGIVGYGNLGQRVASIASAFGMEVKICESFRPEASNFNTDRVPFETLLASSDFISIHCPLSKESRKLFSTKAFKSMKESAILINTARGGIVDSEALINALDHAIIAGAALDVFEQEPLLKTHPLLEPRPNLLVTPHIAWASREARQRLVLELLHNIQAWNDGKIRNQIHPS